MHPEYVKLIAELDKALSLVRTLWLESSSPEVQAKWRTRLDGLLDERLRLMRARDATQTLAA